MHFLGCLANTGLELLFTDLTFTSAVPYFCPSSFWSGRKLIKGVCNRSVPMEFGSWGTAFFEQKVLMSSRYSSHLPKPQAHLQAVRAGAGGALGSSECQTSLWLQQHQCSQGWGFVGSRKQDAAVHTQCLVGCVCTARILQGAGDCAIITKAIIFRIILTHTEENFFAEFLTDDEP